LGDNKISIVLTSSGGAAKTYSLTVTRRDLSKEYPSEPIGKGMWRIQDFGGYIGNEDMYLFEGKDRESCSIPGWDREKLERTSGGSSTTVPPQTVRIEGCGLRLSNTVSVYPPPCNVLAWLYGQLDEWFRGEDRAYGPEGEIDERPVPLRTDRSAGASVLDRDLVLGWMELGFGRAKKTCFRKKRTNNTHFGESKSVGSNAGDL
jgi:hypothetical protein